MSLDRQVSEIFSAPGAVGPHSVTTDSIRAPKDSVAARNESTPVLTPIPLSQLGEGEAVTWAWTGFLGVGFVTLLTGFWKAGKTTLVANLLGHFAEGGELAGTVNPARVLVVTEESAGLWRRRRDELRIGDHVHLLTRPFKVRPRLAQWEGFILAISGLVRTNGYGVVVFDTLPSLWPVVDENAASDVLAALLPLHAVTEAGAAVLLTHHPRKGDGGEGQASRGSGALPGFVDVIVELRRFTPDNRDDRRRTLTTLSRFDESPGEVVVELADDGYRLVGSKADAKQADRLDAIAEILPSEGPGVTADELRESWPDGGMVRPGKRTLQLDLQAGAKAGRWVQLGTGKRNDAHRYVLGAGPCIPGDINSTKCT